MNQSDQNINLIKLFTRENYTVNKIIYFYPDLRNIDKIRIDSYIKNSKLVLFNVFAEHNYLWNLDFIKKLLIII